MGSRFKVDNLAEAALQLGRDEYPQLDVDAYIARLDAMAAEVRAGLAADCSAVDIAMAINEYLFDDQGYSGNSEDYYDPRNSFLHEVLDRKLGIPITLAMIYIEIARRLGLDAEGVGFPGHFLVKYQHAGQPVIVDPYYGGVVLSAGDLNVRLRRVYGERAPTIERAPVLLQGASNDSILVRMLRNLKGIYLQRREHDKALWVLGHILVLAPDSSVELQDRARLYEEMECLHHAADDLSRYLELHPEAKDAAAIRSRMIDMRREAGTFH